MASAAAVANPKPPRPRRRRRRIYDQRRTTTTISDDEDDGLARRGCRADGDGCALGCRADGVAVTQELAGAGSGNGIVRRVSVSFFLSLLLWLSFCSLFVSVVFLVLRGLSPRRSTATGCYDNC